MRRRDVEPLSGVPLGNEALLQSVPESRRMDIVVVGHVDHGKSTLIGRLLADTGSLPEGKLEQVRAMCETNARPFEYAFLLDALKNEQSQGITIDTARCFFRTAKRQYIIHDAPGHIEFLKNMVTGATRAQAALVLIDAAEGIQENSKRHGYILSMLGIAHIAVLVNKMDLAGYDESVFQGIRDEYEAFLSEVDVHAEAFIPIAAREGANIAVRSAEMAWYDGPTVLEQLDTFPVGLVDRELPFRMPVQDVYRFTAEGDDRRIVAGTVDSGTIRAGDEVTFLPSRKKAAISTIETFATGAPESVGPDEAVGFTIRPQVYVRPGELMVRSGETFPRVARRFRANVFWLGRAPMVPGRRYKLKMGAARVPMELVEVKRVVDASDLRSVEGRQQLDRHDVGECVVESLRPLAYDLSADLSVTSRFVVVDGFDIAGFGIVLKDLPAAKSLLETEVTRREQSWVRGGVSSLQRIARNGHSGKAIVFVGAPEDGTRELAQALERRLFERGSQAYFLGLSEAFDRLDPSSGHGAVEREEHLRQLGELARIMADAGLLFITALSDISPDELETLRVLSVPRELLVVTVGEDADAEAGSVHLPPSPPVEESLGEVERKLGDLGVVEYNI